MPISADQLAEVITDLEAKIDRARENPDRRRLSEVLAGLAAMMILLGLEWALYGASGVGEDAADIVTLCGFGGIAATGLGLDMRRGGRELASLTLGVIVGLALIHGARKGADAGPGAWLFGVVGSSAGDESGPWLHAARAVSTVRTSIGVAAALVAYCIQLMVDAQSGTRRWPVLLTVLATAAAAGLVALTANSDLENGYLVELPPVVAVVISLVSAVLIEGAFLVAFLVFVFALGFDPLVWEPRRPRMVHLAQWRVYVALVLLIVLVPLVGRAVQVWSLQASR